MSNIPAFQVSVLIAVYNAERFVTKAVESALAQEEVSEILLIEDGSPDNALSICLALAEKYPRVKVIQHSDKKNHGAPASWNLGLQNANYDFVAFCGADDYFLPGRFIKDREILVADASIDGVYSAIAPVPLDPGAEKTILTLERRKDGYQYSMDHIYQPEDLFENMEPIGCGGFFSLNGLTVRRTVFAKTGYFDPQLRLSQDTDMCIKLAAVCRLVPGALKSPVAMYGVHQNNRSHVEDKLTANRPYLFNSLYRWARRKKLKQERLFLLWQKFYEYYLLVNKPTRGAQVALLLKEAALNPGLLRSIFFRKQLPLIHRFVHG